MKYKVTDPKGIHAGGKHIAKGDVVTLPDGAALKAFLHFKQVAPLEEKKPAADPGDKEPQKPAANPDKPGEKTPEKPEAKPEEPKK